MHFTAVTACMAPTACLQPATKAAVEKPIHPSLHDRSSSTVQCADQTLVLHASQHGCSAADICRMETAALLYGPFRMLIESKFPRLPFSDTTFFAAPVITTHRHPANLVCLARLELLTYETEICSLQYQICRRQAGLRHQMMAPGRHRYAVIESMQS